MEVHVGSGGFSLKFSSQLYMAFFYLLFFSCSFGVDWKLSSPCTSSMPELSMIVKTDNASWKSLVPKTSKFNLNILVSSSCGIKISQCNQHDQDIIWAKEGGNWDFHSRCKVLMLLLFCLFVFSPSLALRQRFGSFKNKYSQHLELLWDFRLRSYCLGWTFDQLKILIGHFVHTGPFNICALFTRNFEPPGVWISVRLRRFRVNGTPKSMNFQAVENSSSAVRT